MFNAIHHDKVYGTIIRTVPRKGVGKQIVELQQLPFA